MSRILGKLVQVRGFAQGSLRLLSTSKIKCCCPNAAVAFKTLETNPGNHTEDDIGLIYGIDNSLGMDGLFSAKSILNYHYKEECKTFNETYMMIRKPALEVIHYLKNANYDDPIIKYVLYGKYGSGKSMTLLNIIHYAHLSGWLIVHVPWVVGFLTTITERTPLKNDENVFDLPAMGSAWLLHFKTQNLELLNKLDVGINHQEIKFHASGRCNYDRNLRIQNDYTWNVQVEHKKGDTLLSVLDLGISRGKYSCDIILAILKEIKLWSKNKQVKTLVAINPYNTLFERGRKCRNKKRKFLSPKQVSFLQGFKDLTLSDWHNGAAVLICQAKENSKSNEDHLPLNKLSKEGFEFIDPFVPIEVPLLTNKEMESLLAYYRSKKWLLHSRGDRELKLVSCGNFEYLRNLCQFA